MSGVFGTHRVQAHVRVNHKAYKGADDIREHIVEVRIDLDAIVHQLAAKACRSRAGKSTGMHSAIVCKQVKP